MDPPPYAAWPIFSMREATSSTTNHTLRLRLCFSRG